MKTNPQKFSIFFILGFILVGMVIPILIAHNLAVQLFPSSSNFKVQKGQKLLEYDVLSLPDESPAKALYWYYYDQSRAVSDALQNTQDENKRRVIAPTITLAEISPLAVNGTNAIVLLFWVGSLLLLWRQFSKYEVRILFLLSQGMGITMLYPLAHYPVWLPPLLLIVVKFLGYFLIPSLLLHFVITFPVRLGNSPARQLGLRVAYLSSIGAFAGWLLGGITGWRVGGFLSFSIVVLAIGLMMYIYRNHGEPDDRRRLRLIVFGTVFSGLPPTLFYMLPESLGYSLAMPEWMAPLFLLIAPVSYLYAIARHKLFGIDRLLNRTLVYIILSLGIFILYVGPVFFLYQCLPDNQFLEVAIISGVTLMVGWSFEWARDRTQRFVDKLFFGGWYDYPGVVETVSETLASTLERIQIRDVLTRQVPELMQLSGAHLWIGESNATYPQMASMPERFRFKFRSDVPAQWTVGGHRDGSDLNSADLRILNTLAKQAEVALNNVLLVEELRHQLVEIQASRKTLSQAQHQLLRSREEERSHLARELHDGPIQSLVGLNIQIGLLVTCEDNNSPLGQALGEMRQEVRQLLSELRQVCSELRPPMLDALGLGAALRAYAEDWRDQCGIELDLYLLPNQELQDLPNEVALNLYRVAQEALTNVARHASANHASITVKKAGEQLTMTIQDDGCGFPLPDTFHGLPAQDHYGMVGMRERIELIGGRWRLQSEPGQGTVVTVTWVK